jgi:hypothetical protein
MIAMIRYQDSAWERAATEPLRPGEGWTEASEELGRPVCRFDRDADGNFAVES